MAKSSRQPSRSSMADDIDAITPCPPPTKSQDIISPIPTSAINDYRTRRSESPSSVCSSLDAGEFTVRRRASVKALEEGTNGDPEALWRRMLRLQQEFGCYNSARMSAALSSGDASLLRPSKACLDLLNETMTILPDEAEPVHGGWRRNSEGDASPTKGHR
ncbi:Uu.00g062320.m01.CDS01 [Anthostomella pinea]|uniref:Uu.00g062320.m01.CDS01 n=1 Tax=Anthostomella pinea TaxID=933095 RepID=A0AAI8YKH1_9PEZI|nr:Uu.00g062320.m01.CDS01 [Anthostomella pinea]